MKITNEEKLKNVDERIQQYFSLILKTIIDISELLEKRKEIIKEIGK
jgi:hypothetical protein